MEKTKPWIKTEGGNSKSSFVFENRH